MSETNLPKNPYGGRDKDRLSVDEPEPPSRRPHKANPTWFILDPHKAPTPEGIKHCARCKSHLVSKPCVPVTIDWLREYVKENRDGNAALCVPCWTICKASPAFI